GDMIDAVRPKGLRVVFSTHPEQPVFGLPNDRWNDFLNDLYGEVATRYGSRLDGLYLDENTITGEMDQREDFPRLERTIRARAPHLMLMQNFYGNMYACDLGVAEYTSQQPADPLTWGVGSYQGIAHVMSRTWSAQVPRGQNAVPYTPEGIFRFTVMQAGTCLDGGGTFWAAGPYPGGGWETGVLPAMQRVGALIAPIARSIKGTLASTSYPTPTGTAMAALTWGVATRSPDDRSEYLHVLKPPATRTLELPAPADGKVFGSAHLLATGRPLPLHQDSRGVQVTLGPDDAWDPLDTVIELSVASQGGRGLVNDTSASVRYSGRGWSYGQARGMGEYQDDIHTSAADGAGFTLAFNGTEVALVVSAAREGGRLALSIDGAADRIIDLPKTGGTRQTVYKRVGLADGPHSLRGELRGVGRLLLDAFQVGQAVNDNAPSVVYGTLVTLNDTHPSIVYTGGSWHHQTGRDMGELEADIHYATADGDSFTLPFEGTGVEFLSNCGGGRAQIDFYLDDVFQGTVDMAQGMWARNLKLALRGLPAGPHRLRGVKKSGTYMEIDMFRVYLPNQGKWQAATAPGALSGDLHTTVGREDFCQVSFEGTGVDFVSRLDPAGGTVDFFLDSTLVRRANHYHATAQAPAVSFSLGGLPARRYTLTAVLRRGASLAVDGFRVDKGDGATR
ncbi:MAG: hypothetical protein HZB16_23200, partial [Armatimonadetes bacterium]|nr:hypothetical protein [Armatimonadota bacterium]